MRRMQNHSNVVLWSVIIFFYLPLLVLIVNSFNVDRFSASWEGFTFKWYIELFDNEVIGRAMVNTLKIAITSTLSAVILGTTAALAIHKWKGLIQSTHYGLIYTHLILPDVLMGVSLLLFFVAIGINLSIYTVYIAHTTFCISYVAMAVMSRLQDFDNSILEAAQDLGANPWQTFWKVQFPNILPGIVAGGLLAFTLSIDDYVITLFVGGQGSDTLPLAINDHFKKGSNLPIINALSTILISITFIAVIASRMLGRNEEKNKS